MAQDNTTSMTLTGVFSGLQMSMTASSGTIVIGNKASAQSGYSIAQQQTDQGKAFSVVTVADEADVVEPATVVVTVDYTQDIELDEVDLEARYTNIPDGTSLQIECSQSTFNISKQPISGSSLISSIGKHVGPLEMSIAVKLWITRPTLLTKNSALTASLVSITGGGGGPVKKTLLEKIAINLTS